MYIYTFVRFAHNLTIVQHPTRGHGVFRNKAKRTKKVSHDECGRDADTPADKNGRQHFTFFRSRLFVDVVVGF